MKRILDNIIHKNEKIVCIQGLGFVGTAMLIAVASRKNKKKRAYLM